MKNKVLRYRFILISIILILVFIKSFNINNYTIMIYSVPRRTIELIFSLSLILSNGYFLVDNIYYYVKMRNEIVLRTNEKSYYMLLFKKNLFCLSIFVLVQFTMNFIASNTILAVPTFLYFAIFILLFFLLNRFLKNTPQDILIIIFSICVFCLRLFFSLI